MKNEESRTECVKDIAFQVMLLTPSQFPKKTNNI